MQLLRPFSQLVPPLLLLLLLLAAVAFTTVAPTALAFAGAPNLPKTSAPPGRPMAATTPRSCPSTAAAAAASASAAEGTGSTGGGSGTPISRVGFGTYRVGGTEDQAAAIREALLNGVTLVDTSANYGDGESEATIGRVVRELVADGKLRREETIIVSKFGYIQGQNLR